jgi:nucleoporin POM152
LSCSKLADARQSFNSLSDRSYSRIKLDKPPIKQTVHPLANVEVVGRADGPKRLRLYACSGDEVDVYVEAKVNIKFTS